jgi:hypothetical protein
MGFEGFSVTHGDGVQTEAVQTAVSFQLFLNSNVWLRMDIQ